MYSNLEKLMNTNRNIADNIQHKGFILCVSAAAVHSRSSKMYPQSYSVEHSLLTNWSTSPLSEEMKQQKEPQRES